MTRSEPTVSVVIAHYNAASTVRETLRSILEQTVTDIEVLVIDDGSRVAPLPEDLPEDPRLIVRRLPSNGGYAHVTNLALDAVHGEWVVFVDADDVIEPTYLEVMLDAGRAADADLVLAAIQCVRDGVEIGTQWWDPPAPVTDQHEAMRALIHNRVSGSQHALFRRPEVRAPEGQTYSDWVLLLRHLARSRRVAFVDEPLYRYTIDPSSISGGLRPSVWDLPGVDELVRPIIEDSFPPREASALIAIQRRHSVTHMLHKAARERRDTPLRREVTTWVRRRLTVGGVLALWREGRRAEAMSWLLTRLSPALHRRAYQAYDDLKTRRRS